MNENWQDLSLGDLYRNSLAKARQLRRTLQTYSPVKVDMQATTNLIGVGFQTIRKLIGKSVSQLLGSGDRPALPSAQELEESASAIPSPRRKPWQTRTEQLETVLAEAWAAGSRTYAQLLAWVREKTGQGCSHRAIARFRKSVQG
jgi:hypothetical protein